MHDSGILFSLDFGLSEHLAPGDEDNTEWDPALGQHNYYHINPSENVSYRYSYDTGEKINRQYGSIPAPSSQYAFLSCFQAGFLTGGGHSSGRRGAPGATWGGSTGRWIMNLRSPSHALTDHRALHSHLRSDHRPPLTLLIHQVGGAGGRRGQGHPVHCG